MTKIVDAAMSMVAAPTVIGVAIILFRPGGIASEELHEWRLDRSRKQTIDQGWSDIVDIESRVDFSGQEVIVVEFSDYECPFCRQFDSLLVLFVERYPNVQVVYRHLPLHLHPSADGAAS